MRYTIISFDSAFLTKCVVVFTKIYVKSLDKQSGIVYNYNMICCRREPQK